MECDLKITEHDVINFWLKLDLSFTSKNKSVVIKDFLCQIFTDSGLKISFDSPDYKTIKRRCERIIDKIKENKRNKQPKYYGFSDPEKIFFSESEFPNLCKRDVQKR